MAPSAVDRLSRRDQVEMAALLTYEASLCAECRQPMDLSLRDDVTWLVEDVVCTSCRAVQGVQASHHKTAEKGNAEAFLHGKKYGVRPKLTSVRGGSDGR